MKRHVSIVILLKTSPGSLVDMMDHLNTEHNSLNFISNSDTDPKQTVLWYSALLLQSGPDAMKGNKWKVEAAATVMKLHAAADVFSDSEDRRDDRTLHHVLSRQRGWSLVPLCAAPPRRRHPCAEDAADRTSARADRTHHVTAALT